MLPSRMLSSRFPGVLCTLLMLQLHLPGCSVPLSLSGGDWISVSLDADHPLSRTLRNSAFAGARVIEINPVLMSFRLRSPDGTRIMSGAMGDRGGLAAVRAFRISSDSASIDFVIDGSDRVVSVSTGNGGTWHHAAIGAAANDAANLMDAYLEANQDLLAAARAIDSSQVGGNDGGGLGTTPALSGKSAQADQSINADLANVLGILTSLLGPQFVAANFPALYFTFQAFVSMQITFQLLGLPSDGGSNGASGSGGGDTATLRVINALASTPVWYVVPLSRPGERALGNLLGEEGIPAGDQRDFSLPPGVRTVNLIVPDQGSCLKIFSFEGVRLDLGSTTVITLSTGLNGSIYPSDCGG